MTRINSNPILVTTLLVMFVGLGTRDVRAQQPPSEPAASRTTFAREMFYLDLNRDGKIGADEFARGQRMAAMMTLLAWEDCDRNGDGTVDPTEFSEAALQAMQFVPVGGQAEYQQAEEVLGQAMQFEAILENLVDDLRYEAEIAALRDAIDDLNDDGVVSYVIDHSAQFPALAPLARTWVRHHPVRAAVRRHIRATRPGVRNASGAPRNLRNPRARSNAPRNLNPSRSPRPRSAHGPRVNRANRSRPRPGPRR